MIYMMSFHRLSSSRTPSRIAKEKERTESRIAGSIQARKQLFIAGFILAIVVAAASWHAHRVLAAHVPNDMPANSRWFLTGRDASSNDKLGLWIACWQSAASTDHCRITDVNGTSQFDGDMLPLAANQGPVAQKDLELSTNFDPAKIWVHSVNNGLPAPVLKLANGTQLVPAKDRLYLQKRLARGEWADDMQVPEPQHAQPDAEQ